MICPKCQCRWSWYPEKTLPKDCNQEQITQHQEEYLSDQTLVCPGHNILGTGRFYEFEDGNGETQDLHTAKTFEKVELPAETQSLINKYWD